MRPPSPDQKALTIRLSGWQAEDLRKAAETDGISQADFIREAVAQYVTKRKADPAFRAQVKVAIRRLEALLP